MTSAADSRRGGFITLEGIEGVGKSANLQFVAGLLRTAGLTVVVTREPGGVPAAERIRELLLAPGEPSLPPVAELLLMFAARAVHLRDLVEPALAAGSWVVCDRFTDATYAYQGAGRGLPEALIAQLENAVQGNLRPHLTLLLDADWEATRGRRIGRGAGDRFEQEDVAFFTRVRAGYLARARAEPQRVCIIDAALDLDRVRESLGRAVTQFLERHRGQG